MPTINKQQQQQNDAVINPSAVTEQVLARRNLQQWPQQGVIIFKGTNITFLSSTSELNLKVKLCDSHFQHSETPFHPHRCRKGRRRGVGVGVGGGTMHINETSRTIGMGGMEYQKSVPRCTYYTGSRTATQAMLQL